MGNLLFLQVLASILRWIVMSGLILAVWIAVFLSVDKAIHSTLTKIFF